MFNDLFIMNNNLFNLFGYTLLYYQLDNIFKVYLYDTLSFFQQDPIIFYPVIQSANVFIFFTFFIFTTYLLLFSKIKNYTVYSLSFIYMKYVMDMILNSNIISIYQYEFRRTVMWFFTTPLILKLYSDMNHLSLLQVHSQYHIISNLIHICFYPLRSSVYHFYIILGLGLCECYFIYRLFEFKEKKYTKFIIYIWSLFSVITFIDLTKIINVHNIQICYLLSDMIAKLTTMLIVNDNEEQIYFIRQNIDLQSISFLAEIKKTIYNFEKKKMITPKCKSLITHINTDIHHYIPLDKTPLKLELLKKILPMELEDKYLTQTKEYISYDNICVLFIDIVSYTELAKMYEDSVIYKLLNDVYTRFDSITNCYPKLQKIETIGDAYMVVSDIYTNSTDVKSMFLLAVELLKEIKKIPSPNQKELQLRIGIHIGKVAVGILGIEIPRLCIIGNTVNMANRIQTSADADCIQVSKEVYKILQTEELGGGFIMRENVFLKNIGSVTTYITNMAQIDSEDSDSSEYSSLYTN